MVYTSEFFLYLYNKDNKLERVETYNTREDAEGRGEWCKESTSPFFHHDHYKVIERKKWGYI